nr:hypothetical protein [Tanacetum cinerariifolium]
MPQSRGSVDEGEAAAAKRSTKRGSDDTKKMVNVLTSLDVAKILTSGGAQVSISPTAEFITATVSIPTGSGSIPTASSPDTGIPTGSGMVPTASLIFTTATESTPYTRRKGKEKMVESDTPKKKKLQEHIDQRKPLSRKQHKDFYMSVLRSHAGWKARHFKGMTLEEIKEKFDPVWKQIQDFILIGSKEESERFKRKGLRQLIPVEKLWALVKKSLNIRPTTNDKEKELWVELKRLYEPDVKDLLWTHTQNLMHAPVEWKLYDTYGVHHVISKDQEIFMLVEKDYPLRKGIPTASEDFPLAKQFPTANEEKIPLLSQSDATAEELCAVAEVKE